MTPIKIILIVILLLVLRAFLVQKSLILIARVVASLMFFCLLLLVLFPDVSIRIANVLGVGRGVDLLFYFSQLFFLFIIIALWRRTIVLMNITTKLSRAIALQNPDKPHKKKRPGRCQN